MVDITTVNEEEPLGTNFAKPNSDPPIFNYTYTNKVPCHIVITSFADTIYDSGLYDKNISGATIRINGNTSAYYSEPLNMPYKLKLEKKADLLSRGDNERYKDKNWRLLKDATSLNTIVGLKLSQIIGMEWTSAYIPCNLVINGDYRGCYLLMETVRRNPSCRISCDKQQGYIVERDPYWWKEDQWFSSSWYDGSSMYRWTWKYPDEDNLSEQQETYIQQYINHTEQSIADGNYDDYIDVESFARWLLAHDILGTRDSGGSNMYFKKTDESDSTRLEMPCLWDFDSNYEVTPGSFSRLHTSSNAYFSSLLASSNRTFANCYVRLWNEKKDTIRQQLTDFINAFLTSQEGRSLNASRQLYNLRWNYDYPMVESDVQRALTWLDAHLDKLDSQIQLIETDPDFITPSNTAHQQCPIKTFDLRGIQLKSASPGGLVIRQHDGKTIKTIRQ